MECSGRVHAAQCFVLDELGRRIDPHEALVLRLLVERVMGALGGAELAAIRPQRRRPLSIECEWLAFSFQARAAEFSNRRDILLLSAPTILGKEGSEQWWRSGVRIWKVLKNLCDPCLVVRFVVTEDQFLPFEEQVFSCPSTDGTRAELLVASTAAAQTLFPRLAVVKVWSRESETLRSRRRFLGRQPVQLVVRSGDEQGPGRFFLRTEVSGRLSAWALSCAGALGAPSEELLCTVEEGLSMEELFTNYPVEVVVGSFCVEEHLLLALQPGMKILVRTGEGPLKGMLRLAGGTLAQVRVEPGDGQLGLIVESLTPEAT